MALSFLKLDNPQGKKFWELSDRERTIIILKAIAIGAVVVSVIVAPGLGAFFKFLDANDKRKRRALANKVRYLARAGYIEKRGARYRLAENGRRKLTEADVWDRKPAQPKRWDGKWRLVLFDIPGKKETARQALRARLFELGAVRYQNSVFVYPHDLRPALEQFARFYGIAGALRYVTADRIDEEERFKRRFSLD